MREPKNNNYYYDDDYYDYYVTTTTRLRRQRRPLLQLGLCALGRLGYLLVRSLVYWILQRFRMHGE